MSVQYVRAVYDFVTSEAGEICLHVGDVILVLYSIDENWICGKLFGQVGNFPTPFVTPVSVPHIQPGQKLFVGQKDFTTNMSGDLAFVKGEIVVGLKPIDKSWWHGQKADKFGMFPVTHVRELDTAPPEDYGAIHLPQAADVPSPVSHQTSVSATATSVEPSSASSVPQASLYIAKAVANMDLTAQIDEELGFRKGEVINIIKVTDSDFAIGECNGKTGTLCLSFVDVIEGDLKKQQEAVCDKQEKKRSKFRWWEDESGGAVQPGKEIQTATPPQKNTTQQPMHNNASYNAPASPIYNNSKSGVYISEGGNEQSSQQTVTAQYSNNQVSYDSHNNTPMSQTDHEMSHIVNNSQDTNNTTTITSNNLQEPVVKTHRRTGSYTQENTRYYDTSLTPYGKTVFPFVAENPNELTFFDNEIVTLIQHVDDQWIEGEVEGKRGIFPASYINIIVDCPWCEDYQRQMSVNQSVDDESMLENVTEESINEDSYQNQNVAAGSMETEQEPIVSSNTNPLTNQNQGDIISNAHPANQSERGEEIISNSTGANEQITSNNNQSQFQSMSENDESLYGMLMYDFKPESGNPEDLTFLEGDTVTILKQADEHWFEVIHDDGRHGFCPINYVEVIHSEPLGSPTMCDVSFDEQQSQVVENKNVDGSNSGDNKDDIVNEVEGSSNLEQSKIESSSSLPSESESSSKITNNKRVKNSGNQISVNDTVITNSESQSLTASKPKPLIKPKPALKPKPTSSSSNVSIQKSNSGSSVNEEFSGKGKVSSKSPLSSTSSIGDEGIDEPSKSVNNNEKDSISDKELSSKSLASNGIDEDGDVIRIDSNTSVVYQVPPKRPPPIPPTQRMNQKRTDDINKKIQNTSNPVFARTDSFTMDSSLDNIIKDQMKIATEEASESRSRSSSVRSDSSNSSQPAIPPRRADIVPVRNYTPLKELQKTSSNQGSQQQEKKVAFSTFYDSFSSTTVAPSKQQAPSRPPGAPPQQQGSIGKSRSPTTRPPPPKLSATRGNPQVGGNTRNQNSSLIPRRQAPPRPKHMAARTANNDLMLFSPDGEKPAIGSEQPPGVNAENAQVVADLDKRIHEIEDDIQAYTKNRQELERFLNKHRDGSSPEESEKVKENLDFTVANITGLSSELNQLRENLYEYLPDRRVIDEDAQRQAQQQRLLVEEQRKKEEEEKKNKEEAVKKRVGTRKRVIEELVQTEKDYLRSISVCYDTFFNDNVSKHPLVDHDLLFGNIEEVIQLSQRLLSSLEEATQGKEFHQQKLGECFVHLKKDMTNVYAPYCQNHDDVMNLLENYEKNPEIQEYFVQKVEKMKNQMTVFDLGSVLIKPVQRVLKYPLLLNELIKNTEEDHADKFHLLGAITCMMQVASTINEFKRRKDLVRKYKAEKKDDLGDKLSRLNVHSTKKKLSRLSTHLAGVQTIDEGFNHEEKKYKNLETSVRTLVRNISQYIEQVQLSVFGMESLANDLSDYYAEKCGTQEVQQYCRVANKMATKHFYAFRRSVEVPVIRPLNRLLVLYQAPNKVIKKRYDKLLDYDNLSSYKGQGDSTMQKNVQMAKNNYEALNAQLLDELPQLFKLSMEIIIDCLNRFVEAQKLFHAGCLEEIYTLLGLQLVLSSPEQDMLETFNITHQQMVEKLSDLSFMTKAFNPRLEDRKGSVRAPGRRSSEKLPSMDCSNQSDAQRQLLQQQYPGDKLFTVAVDVAAAQPMDLSLCRGCLVAIMKEGDPMGNKDRWFVYNGGEKGFVLKKYLVPYSPTKSARSGSVTLSAGQPYGPDLLGTSDIGAPPVSPGINSSWNNQSSTEVFDPFTAPTIQQPLQPQLSPANQSTTTNNQSNLVINQSSTSPNYLRQSSSVLQPQLLSNNTHQSQQRSKSESCVMRQTSGADFSQSVTGSNVSKQPSLTQSDTFDELDEVEEIKYYQAIYPFQARTELEITLVEGQYVKIIENHDLEGNPEWWLVESQGHKGYAPANYIQEVE